MEDAFLAALQAQVDAFLAALQAQVDAASWEPQPFQAQEPQPLQA